MPLHLSSFCVSTQPRPISFHDGFCDARHELNHDAIDVGVPAGTPIFSTTDGVILHSWTARRDHRTVTGCGWSERGGNIVMIYDANGFAHYYAHMRELAGIRAGQRITAGTTLGYAGNTGSIAHGGPIHLHYQVWQIGSGRQTEIDAATFTRPFGAAVNPYSELCRLARTLGATVGRSGGVRFAGREMPVPPSTVTQRSRVEQLSRRPADTDCVRLPFRHF